MSRRGSMAACAAAVFLSGCVTASTQWSAAAIDVRSTPPDVLTLIDGIPVGLAGQAPIGLPPDCRTVRVELRRDGFLPRRLDVGVQQGRLHVIEVELWPVIPELDESTP